MAGSLRLFAPLGRNVPAYEEGGDLDAELGPQSRYGLHAGLALLEVAVGDDKVRPSAADAVEHLPRRLGGQHAAAPLLQQPAHRVQHQHVVVDHHNRFAAQCCRWRSGLETGAARNGGRHVDHRHGDREPRALAEIGLEAYRMIEQRPQAFDDCEPQPKPILTSLLLWNDLVELVEYVALLVCRNAAASIAYVDAQLSSLAAASHHYAAGLRVAHGVGDEIEQDPLKQYRIAAHPGPAPHDVQSEPFVAGRGGERRFHALQDAADREIRDAHLDGTGIELRNVEKRVEQPVHVVDGGFHACREAVPLRRIGLGAELSHE